VREGLAVANLFDSLDENSVEPIDSAALSTVASCTACARDCSNEPAVRVPKHSPRQRALVYSRTLRGSDD
jgi:hypothetical protein